MKLTTIKPRLSTTSMTRALPVAKPAIERKRGSAGVSDREKIRKRDKGLCQVCKRPGYIVDHVIPLWDGGGDEDSDKSLICAPCHDAKSELEAAIRESGGSVPRPGGVMHAEILRRVEVRRRSGA